MGYDNQGVPDSQTDDSQSIGLSSPGKRKYNSSDDELSMLEPNQYPRMNVTETELREEPPSVDGGLMDAGIMEDVKTTNGHQAQDLIVGVDPSLIMKDGEGSGQEMKERGGMPMLSGRKMSQAQMNTIDSMDLDQVVEDEHIAEESTAVKRVGFVE